MKKNKKGFSLIELLIVVAIILIIAAIAIPNLLKSRISANEASAVGSVRTIVTSEITYAIGNPTVGITTLANLNTAGLIDNQLSAGNKSGYSFAISAGTETPPSSFVAGAAPLSINTTGIRSFCGDASAVIRYVNPAASTTPPTVCNTGQSALQ